VLRAILAALGSLLAVLTLRSLLASLALSLGALGVVLATLGVVLADLEQQHSNRPVTRSNKHLRTVYGDLGGHVLEPLGPEAVIRRS